MEQRYGKEESLIHSNQIFVFSASLMGTSNALETPVLRIQRIVKMVSRFQFGKKWNIQWISSMSQIQRPLKRGKYFDVFSY